MPPFIYRHSYTEDRSTTKSHVPSFSENRKQFALLPSHHFIRHKATKQKKIWDAVFLESSWNEKWGHICKNTFQAWTKKHCPHGTLLWEVNMWPNESGYVATWYCHSVLSAAWLTLIVSGRNPHFAKNSAQNAGKGKEKQHTTQKRKPRHRLAGGNKWIFSPYHRKVPFAHKMSMNTQLWF